MSKKFLKIAIFIPALAGLFLMSSVPTNTTKNNSENTLIANDEDEDEEVIKIDKTVHDFGTVKESGGALTATFTLTNNTKNPVIINDAKASCGCTAPSWTDKPIDPGKTGTVTATYNPKARALGGFEKTVTIYTSGTPQRIVVKIKGVSE